MSRSLQREWFMDILESAPSIVFLSLWRSGFGLELAGWVGAGLAASLLVGFRLSGVRCNPILLGINIHLVIITPLIVALFYLGMQGLGGLLVAHSYEGVLLTIFLTGCVLTFCSPAGFVGASGPAPARARNQSIPMLAAATAAVLWAFAVEAGPFVTVALPIIGLFALRRLLIARSVGRNTNLSGVACAGLVPSMIDGEGSG